MKIMLILAIVIVGLFAFFRILTLLSRHLNDMSPEEVAVQIENFVEGKGGPRDWDDFICVPIKSERLDKIRERCACLDEEFPPEKKGMYCSEKGMEVLRGLVKELRGNRER